MLSEQPKWQATNFGRATDDPVNNIMHRLAKIGRFQKAITDQRVVRIDITFVTTNNNFKETFKTQCICVLIYEGGPKSFHFAIDVPLLWSKESDHSTQ